MATAFMRWLERRPATYDRGIRLLTLGRLPSLYSFIADRIQTGQRVLEIGCGTGSLTALIAAKTDQIEAIDVSADMLVEAGVKLKQVGLLDHVRFTRMDALTLDSKFAQDSFDLIVSSLAFSELSTAAADHVLRLSHRLLKADGRLWILDELQPATPLPRLLASLIRGPLRLLTWLLTRTTTNPLKEVEERLARCGFDAEPVVTVLGGTLGIYQGLPQPKTSSMPVPGGIPRLQHQSTLHTRLQDLWALFFRVIPPYPKFEPGLYAIGRPTHHTPVLVTGNYDLTVRRLVKSIDGGIDAWLLVVDSSGINVWCGAGGGFLTAERVIGALRMSGADEWHTRKRMVLPQLCANGVEGSLIRERTGWSVDWGPVRARDIVAYFENDLKKSHEMRTVAFPLLDRLEMVSATLGLYGLMILIPILIFWPQIFGAALISLLGLSYFYALALPYIPGRDGLQKSLPLALIAVVGMFAYSWLSGPLLPLQLFQRTVGMVALSIFIAAEMQGMSPLMRGEQANWGWEALIAAILAGIYWLLPQLMGWAA